MDVVATCVRTVAVTPRESHEAPIVGEDNAPSFLSSVHTVRGALAIARYATHRKSTRRKIYLFGKDFHDLFTFFCYYSERSYLHVM
jgi:hypothetical protein